MCGRSVRSPEMSSPTLDGTILPGAWISDALRTSGGRVLQNPPLGFASESETDVLVPAQQDPRKTGTQTPIG